MPWYGLSSPCIHSQGETVEAGTCTSGKAALPGALPRSTPLHGDASTAQGLREGTRPCRSPVPNEQASRNLAVTTSKAERAERRQKCRGFTMTRSYCVMFHANSLSEVQL
jgi:hypothetical protein